MIDIDYSRAIQRKEEALKQYAEQFTTDAMKYYEQMNTNQLGTNQSADEVQVGGTHYKDMGMQPWEVMESVLSREEFIGFLRGNIIKYAMRAGKKPNSDDTEKARHYKQKLEEVLKDW